jgi:hypothetical protein
MRKVQLVAVILTLIIATPVTALAILFSAYITDNIVRISRSLGNIPQQLSILNRNLLFETEIIGLVAGTLILLAVLLVALRTNNVEEKSS